MIHLADLKQNEQHNFEPAKNWPNGILITTPMHYQKVKKDLDFISQNA
jgi:hypothetical protein